MPLLFEGATPEQLSEWQEVSDPSILNRVRALDDQGLPWDIIGLDTANAIARANPHKLTAYLPLIAPGTPMNAMFGLRLWGAFREQCRLLVCTDDDRYGEIRSGLNQVGDKLSSTTLATTSAIIATHLGVEAAMLVPLVLIVLRALGKLGKEALCAAIDEDRYNLGPRDSGR